MKAIGQARGALAALAALLPDDAEVVHGDEAHHVCEAMFKGFARALRMAVEADPRESGVPSSKGTI